MAEETEETEETEEKEVETEEEEEQKKAEIEEIVILPSIVLLEEESAVTLGRGLQKRLTAVPLIARRPPSQCVSPRAISASSSASGALRSRR